jgi:outer membrane protein assembly factor BamB
MQRYGQMVAAAFTLFLCSAAASAQEWWQFRGPGGLGISADKNLPAEWSAKKNIVWKTKLPGPGASSPMTVAGRVFVTCYSGYGVQAKEPGKQTDLRRHLVCVDRKDGVMRWTKDFEPSLPEHNYGGEGSYHGYAASTPASDGERLFVFFGKSGVFCFDLDGKQLWHAAVGKNTNGWGSGASPLLYKDLVVINASVESGALIAFDKLTGKEVWRAPKMGSAWNTPLLVTTPEKTTELVVSVQDRVVGLDPDTGKDLWTAEGIHRYVCPSVVAHDGIVYVTGGDSATTAIKTGGRGDVTKSHVLWRIKKGSNTPSPIYHDGYLYYANTNGGTVVCLNAATGETVFNERLMPNAGTIYSSPVLADGKLYYVSQRNGAFVLAVGPKFQLLAHNVFDDDKSRTNASPAVSNGQLLLRTDENLYCIGKRE